MTGLPKLHFMCPEQPFDEKMIKVKFTTNNFFETLSELFFFILTKKVVKVIEKLMYRRETSRKKLLNKTLVVMLKQQSTYPEKKNCRTNFFLCLFRISSKHTWNFMEKLLTVFSKLLLRVQRNNFWMFF